MSVIFQAQEIGEIITELTEISDLAGHASKGEQSETDLFNIRKITQKITDRIYNTGRLGFENTGV